MRVLRLRKKLKEEQGQTFVEYVLVLFVIVTGIIFILGQLKESEFFFKNVTKPLVQHLTYNYKYGDPTAQGWDEGNPRKHIQVQQPAGANFRMFQPQR